MAPPTVPPETGFWRVPIADLLERLGSGPGGLSNAEAKARLVRWGPNQVRGARKRAALLQFLGKFLNPLVIILLIASAISGATGDKATSIPQLIPVYGYKIKHRFTCRRRFLALRVSLNSRTYSTNTSSLLSLARLTQL